MNRYVKVAMLGTGESCDFQAILLQLLKIE
jgi:hypothetical protein